MNVSDFKNEIWALAQVPDQGLNKIEDLMIDFLKDKAIPNLQSNNSFVVRASLNGLGEFFSNISRCSYPPDSCIEKIKIQRANYPKQQVFYCTTPTKSDFASAQSTCVAETAWEYIEDINQSRFYMTLSRWACARPLNLWVLPFAKLASERNKDWMEIRTNMENFILQSGRDAKPLIETLEFISEAFAARENKQVHYKITSAFYNALLFYENYKSIHLDGLMYPSANTEGAGINLAIKKNLIDEGVIKGDIAMMFSVQRSPSNLKNISVMPASREVRVDNNGAIKFLNIW